MALCAGIGKLDSSIAKDLIDSKTPNIHCLSQKNAFVTIFVVFKGQYFHSLIVVQIDLPLLLNPYNIFSVDKTGWLSIEQAGY